MLAAAPGSRLVYAWTRVLLVLKLALISEHVVATNGDQQNPSATPLYPRETLLNNLSCYRTRPSILCASRNNTTLSSNPIAVTA